MGALESPPSWGGFRRGEFFLKNIFAASDFHLTFAFDFGRG